MYQQQIIILIILKETLIPPISIHGVKITIFNTVYGNLEIWQVFPREANCIDSST